MVTREEIFQKLQGLNKKEITCQVATVKSIDTKKKTCTVILQDGLELPDVRLKAAVDFKESEEYYYVIPRPKSTVLIALVGGEPTAGEYYVIAVNEIDSLDLKIDKTEISANKDRLFLIKNKNVIEVSESKIELSDRKTNATKLMIEGGRITIQSGGFVSIKNNTESLSPILQQLINEVKDLKILFTGTTANAGANPVTGYAKIDPSATTRLQALLEKLSNLLI